MYNNQAIEDLLSWADDHNYYREYNEETKRKHCRWYIKGMMSVLERYGVHVVLVKHDGIITDIEVTCDDITDKYHYYPYGFQ